MSCWKTLISLLLHLQTKAQLRGGWKIKARKKERKARKKGAKDRGERNRERKARKKDAKERKKGRIKERKKELKKERKKELKKERNEGRKKERIKERKKPFCEILCKSWHTESTLNRFVETLKTFFLIFNLKATFCYFPALDVLLQQPLSIFVSL